MTRFIRAAIIAVLAAVYVRGGLIVTVAVGLVLLLVLLIAHPVHRCPSCEGRRSVPYGTGRRACTRCKATGRTYRRGAIITHRLVREHAMPRIRDRIRDGIAARTGDDQ